MPITTYPSFNSVITNAIPTGFANANSIVVNGRFSGVELKI